MAIFGLSMVNYPRNRLGFIILSNFQKPYVCVLNFHSKMVFVEFGCGSEHSRYVVTVGGKHLLDDVFRR